MSEPDSEQYGLADSNGPIPFHTGYDDVRAAHRAAEKVGEDHPNESPESVYVYKTDGSGDVTIRCGDADGQRGGRDV